MSPTPEARGRRFRGPLSVRWTWVDWVSCWFVIPGTVGLLLWWAAGDWFASLWFFAPPAFPGAALFLSVMAGIGFRLLRCYWPQPKPMPWWQWPLWAIPPILMAAWIWIERHDERPGLWIDRTLWTPSLFFELDARLAVAGEEVRLRRSIECVRYDIGPAFGGPSGIQSYVTPQSVGQRLDAGGAIMLVVPDVCAELGRWAARTPKARDGATAYPLPEDYLPLIAWTPTPHDPEMIEAYVARSYYERSDARVLFHDLTIRLATPSADAPAEDEFAWFFPSLTAYPPEECGRIPYFALYVVPTSEAEWSDSEAIARLLRSIDKPSLVDWAGREDALRHAKRIPTPFTPWEPSRQRLQPQINGAGTQDEYHGRLIPLRWDGTAFVISPEDHGVVIGGRPGRIRMVSHCGCAFAARCWSRSSRTVHWVHGWG